MNRRVKKLTLILVFTFAACGAPLWTGPVGEGGTRMLPPTRMATIGTQLSETPGPGRGFTIPPTIRRTLSATQTARALATLSANSTSTADTLATEALFTPTATITPSLTSTQGPPLRAHTWTPEPILVQMGKTWGDGCCEFRKPPTMILYSDGLLVLANETAFFEYRPLYNHLERREICRILNTIDQTGFLDYDPNTFDDPGDGAPGDYIQVHAWRSNYTNDPGLAYFAVGGGFEAFADYRGDDYWNRPPTLLPSLRDTFRLLYYYNPGGMKYYKPDKIFVWAYWQGKAQGKPWPLETISLADLLAVTGRETPYYPVTVDGAAVQEWYGTIKNGFYYQGGLSVMLYSRPAWPYEETPSWAALKVSDDFDMPTDPIECKVVDGVLPIPTPESP